MVAFDAATPLHGNAHYRVDARLGAMVGVEHDSDAALIKCGVATTITNAIKSAALR